MPLRDILLLAALAVFAALPSAASAQPGAASPIFINEIHYDNTGTDAGEAIEVVAPEGTSLAGYSLVLYNGSGGASRMARRRCRARSVRRRPSSRPIR